jgi:hypothetical protein
MADDVLERHARVRTALDYGQATIAALVLFLQERASIESTYSKALLKLSKQSLAIDGEEWPEFGRKGGRGLHRPLRLTFDVLSTSFQRAEKITEPLVFEALASLRGDVANESVQHSELATSMHRDVLEPLIRQRDSVDAVNRIVSASPARPALQRRRNFAASEASCTQFFCGNDTNLSCPSV